MQREFTAEIEIVPDAAFLGLLCRVGASFAVVVDGCKPSQNGTYFVRTAELSMALREADAQATVRLTASNIPPQTNEVVT